MSNLDIHLRYPLLRVLSRLNVSNIIRGGSKVVRDSSADFLSLAITSRAANFSFRPILLALYAFVDGLLFSSALVWRFFSGSCLFQKVPCFLGGTKFLEILICAFWQYPGKSSPCILLLLFRNEDWDLFPSLHRFYFGGSLSSSFCRGGEN